MGGSLSKFLIMSGSVLIFVGVLLKVSGKIPWLGRLPGDILIRKEHMTFYFPLATCLLLSIILTILFSIFGKR